MRGQKTYQSKKLVLWMNHSETCLTSQSSCSPKLTLPTNSMGNAILFFRRLFCRNRLLDTVLKSLAEAQHFAPCRIALSTTK
jgi:hypothetical protein